MAVIVETNRRVTVNAVVLSTFVKTANLTMESDPQDSTTMGGSGWKTFLAGLRSGTFTLNFLNDYAAAATDATLWPIFASGTGVTAFTTKQDSGTTTATNPEYQGNLVVSQHSAGGTVGEIPKLDVSYPTTGVITRAVA